MFDNIALDIAIGLIFIYLIYSLLASIFLEILAKMFSLRSRNLVRAIRRMLEDEVPHPKWTKVTVTAWIGEFIRDVYYYFSPIDKHSMLEKFFKHPTIRYLGENSARSKPSYIYPSMFSQTMVQLLRGRNYNSNTDNESDAIGDTLRNNLLNMDEETLVQFKNLFEDARRDTLQFRILMERWYDETMQTAAAWYQRQSQILLIFIGLAMGYSFNIDTLRIVEKLSKDDKAREQMVQMAISRKDNYKDIIERLERAEMVSQQPGDTTLKNAITDLRGFIAEDDSVKNKVSEDVSKAKEILSITPQKLSETYTRCDYFCDGIAGWLITALAISLGAPFWYDLLSKLITVRRMVRKDQPDLPVTTAESRNGTVVG